VANGRFLTKSRFKVGHECSRKLHYTGKPEYPNSNLDNAFLEALAEGGFQVGALAKAYHPGGVEVHTLEKESALAETKKLLERDEVTIFEGAFQFGSLFIRADIVQKIGNELFLSEVKAKSFDASEDQFYNKKLVKKGIFKINSDWEPYIIDLAFQYFVIDKAFPKFKIHPSLFLADKNSRASVDGLNQQFLLMQDKNGRTTVRTNGSVTNETVGKPILIKVNLESEVKVLLDQIYENGKPFEEYINGLASIYVNDLKPSVLIGSKCKACEFRLQRTEANLQQKSGFEECWSETLNLPIEKLREPTVLDIWNFRKAEDKIFDGKYFARDLEREDFSTKESDIGLSQSERQWMQVEKIKMKDGLPYFDAEGLFKESQKWRWPVHFIDFETTMSAIPFNKGRRPYEQIAFQFSHHIMNKDGTIHHKDQYINGKRGFFPNFDFVRNLKTALESDDGTIFRYAAHENTVLCQIRRQLIDSREPDRESLVEWIEQVTNGKEDENEWIGPRTMVDMCELVNRYYYHPDTGGSNSIKKVLPAILSSSQLLKSKYAQPVYGSKTGITSLNYENWTWIQMDNSGKPKDPYKLLPPLFDGTDNDQLESLVKAESIADGGAAMTAYARMQFTEMTGEEFNRTTSALLKYCELDTLAMVMIFEYWRDLLASQLLKAS